jgi:hypothetical protein
VAGVKPRKQENDERSRRPHFDSKGNNRSRAVVTVASGVVSERHIRKKL